MRQELATINPPIELFNPRGEELTTVPIVALLGGLLLECLDPGGAIELTTSGIPPDAAATFRQWRADAIAYVRAPNTSHALICLRCRLGQPRSEPARFHLA